MTNCSPSEIPPSQENKFAELLAPILPLYADNIRVLIEERFGLGGKPALTIKQTCEKFGITEEQYRSLIYGMYAYLTQLSRCQPQNRIADISGLIRANLDTKPEK